MILPTLAKMLVQEHWHRPITGRILCLGPQQIAMSKLEVKALFRSRKGRPQPSAQKPDEKAYVSDRYFFSQFRDSTLDSMDVVDGYGATIVHDLNSPVDPSLHGQFDFIFDGGTFDHLMQLGTAFTNVIRMLKPGGRVLHFNAASGYIGAAYVSFGPDLFYDYYVMNRFLDCRIHILRGTGPGTHEPCDVFYVPDARTKALNSSRHQMVACLAEKADDSTWDAVPVEYTYRSRELRERFAEARRRVLQSRRPMLRCDQPRLPLMRESFKRTRLELAYALERHRAGKFDWDKFKSHRRRHIAGTGYVYLGRL
jgi:hypothetical protein